MALITAPSIRASVATVALMAASMSAQVERRGDLYTYLDSTILAMPSAIGTNDYLPPSAPQFAQFRVAVEQLLSNDAAGAATTASSIGYVVVAFTDTTSPAPRLHRILTRHPDSARHWGTIVVAAVPDRPSLVLQSPHPLFDTKTGQQSAWIYRMIGARALFLSGAHRCNSLLPSPCAGTTTVCSGAVEPFRISDPAHNVDHPFQAATLAAISVVPQPVFIQLHGFGKDLGDPDVIMSNGTRSASPVDLVAALRDQLLLRDDSLTFKIAHIDSSWSLLTGTTNVQGRLVNGSIAPCTQSASVPSGRFIHIEQAFQRLRNNVSSWSRVGAAIAAVFPPTTSNAGNVEIPSSPELLVSAFPNPFNPSAVIRWHLPHPAQVRVSVYDVTGRLLDTIFEGAIPAGEHHVTWSPRIPSGTYLCRIVAQPLQPGLAEMTGAIRLVLVR
jgi:hypothetical protein